MSDDREALMAHDVARVASALSLSSRSDLQALANEAVAALLGPRPAAADQGVREDEIERIKRLQSHVRRCREEANMDDRAAANSKNPDAAPYFAASAVDKRQRADDIDAILALLPKPVDRAGEIEAEIVAWLRGQLDPVERIDDRLAGLIDGIERGDYRP